MPYKMALYLGENLALPKAGDVFVVTEIAESVLEFHTGELVLVKAVVTLDAIRSQAATHENPIEIWPDAA